MRIALLALAAALAASAPAAAQQDTTAAADTAAADTTAADTLPAAEAATGGIPSLEGYRKIAILSRDMLPGTPGYETSVEVHRGPDGAQVLRFLTRGVAWGIVVRPAGASESYTLRDFDCSGAFAETLEAGTPLAVPDCAVPAAPGAAPAAD